MRLLFCLTVLLSFCFNTFAQSLLDKKISISFSQKTLADLLVYIEKETDAGFMYEDKLIDVRSSISINEHDRTVYYILRKAIPDESIAFTCMGNQIILHKKKKQDLPPSKKQTSASQKYIPKYYSVYDTVSLVYFDTVVTRVVDTTVVLVYDTLINIVEKQAEKKRNFEYLLMPSFESVGAGAANTFDSLNQQAPGLNSSLCLQAMAYKTGRVQFGAGLSFRYMSYQFDYDISKKLTATKLDTIYFEQEYYDYFMNYDTVVTSFGDEVLIRYLDSALEQMAVPQTVIQETTSTEKFSSSGRAEYAFIGLPLSLKFQLHQGTIAKLSAELQSELMYMIYYKGFASRLDNPVAPDFTVQKFNWSLKAGVSYEYDLKKRLSFVAKPYVTITNYSLYKAGNKSMKYGAGLGIGLIFR